MHLTRQATPRALTLLFLLALLPAPAPAAAQEEGEAARDTTPIDPRARTDILRVQGGSAVVVAGPAYKAQGLRRKILGDDYRQLWTTPATVPVLDLGTFAGGLTPTEEGGGNQTYSLRLRGANGIEYNFRSTNKEQGRGLQRDLKGTIVHDILQDQVHSLHPGGHVIADRLLDAAGVLHVSPRNFVMPDDPRLGRFRQRYAGMLGTLEERTSTGRSEVPEIRAAADIEGSGDFMAALDSFPDHRLDLRDYLAGRLMDLLFGDWDRHEDQYRWARYDRGGLHVWRAIPRDRDYVFVDYDGWMLDAARGFLPKAVTFDREYEDQIFGLSQNAQFMDRRLFGGLTRAMADSVARALQARVTDAVIDDAVRRTPPEWYAAYGSEVASILRSRRDHLHEASMAFYEMLAGEPEVYGTEQADLAVVDRGDDGTLNVRLYAGGGAGAPYFERVFAPDETSEVRIFLQGGDDRAVVRGASRSAPIKVRVVGEEGDDVLADSSAAGYTAFYDEEGDNQFVRRSGTKVDTRDYTPPPYTRGAGAVPPRDWGGSSSFFAPHGEIRGRIGVVVGGGPSWTRYGFRRFPQASRHHVRALVAPEVWRFGVEYEGRIVFTGSTRRLDILARATELLGSDFHGFGNDSPEETDRDLYRIYERTLLLEPTWRMGLSRRSFWTLGPTLRWTDPEVPFGSPADLVDPIGTRSFGVFGMRTGVELEHRDTPTFPRRGWAFEAEAGGYLGGEDFAADPFGTARVVGMAYLSPGRAGPILAMRAGARAAVGDYPFQYAALLGGGSTLRGFRGQRFAGDFVVHGTAEVRQPLFRAELIVKGDLGVVGLAEAGRVWFDGDSPGDWHTAVGGGAFFAFLDRSRTVALTYVKGEVGRVYFSMGLPF